MAAEAGGGRFVQVTVARSDARAPTTFRVDPTDIRVVLDLLVAIQRVHDPTLAFRYSCRIAACGTCTVRVNGRPALACQTIVRPETRRVRLEPLGGLPVIRDLVVDMSPFDARWAAVGPSFEPAWASAGSAAVAPTAPERRSIDPNLDCIGCGACFAACGMAADGLPFLGPAALNRAFVLAVDSRDGGGAERVWAVAGDAGIDACHGIGACTLVCPKRLDPAGSIRALRRLRVRPGSVRRSAPA